MTENATPPGYETRDIAVGSVVTVMLTLTLVGGILLGTVWGFYRDDGAAVPPPAELPVVTPGERSVNRRLDAVPPPRLEGLRELTARPPGFRSSVGEPGKNSPEIHPEDLRPDRYPQLQSFGWVDRAKGVARIPVGRAMAVIAAQSGEGGAAR